MKIREYSRQDTILLELLNEGASVSFSGLCIRFKVSERTMRTEIHSIKEYLERNGLYLKKSKNSYFIECENDTDKSCIKKIKEEVISRYKTVRFEMQIDRIMFVLQKLLLSNDFIRIADMADEMYVSKSTVSSDMKKIHSILEKYSLSIINKPHYGMKIEGSESSIRKCILDYGLISQDIFCPNSSFDIWSKIIDDPDYKTVNKIVSEIIDKEEFCMYRSFLNNLVTHIILLVKRIRSQCYVEQFISESLDSFSREFLIAKHIALKLKEIMDIDLPDSEVIYIQYHLIGKQNEKYDSVEYDELKYLTDRMIQTSSELYNCDFFSDSLLRNDLLIHLRAVKSRLAVGTFLRNPMLEEIKSQYPFAFEIAVNSAKNDWNWLGIMTEDEIGYIAVHFAAFLERTYKNKKIQAKNVLLICASGIGTARLIEARLRQCFKEKINIIVSDCVSDSTTMFEAYDLVLSTLPLETKCNNVMCIHSIPSHSEMAKIHDYLFGKEFVKFSIRELFKKEFFSIKEVSSKEELLKEMCNEFVKANIVEDGYYEAVMQREECSTTAVGNLLALPHSIKPLAKTSLIYPYIIKNRIKWTDEYEVQIVFLLAFRFKDSKRFTDIYDLIVQLAENKEFIYQCINCNNYDEFINVLESIQRVGEYIL